MTHPHTSDATPIQDIGDLFRRWAKGAWNVAPDRLTPVERALDLPVVAAMAGPQGGRRMFRAGADPYAHARAFAYGARTEIGIDMVRIEASTPLGPLTVVDTACFMAFRAPPKTPLEDILNLDGPVTFHPTQAEGWISTAPDTDVRDMTDWSTRIDETEVPGGHLRLLIKITDSDRLFTPSLEWF